MSGRVHQEDETKLHGTTYEARQLIPFEFDYIGLTYTGDNLTTVVYKTGGSGGTTVATLTLAYTGSVLDSVTRT